MQIDVHPHAAALAKAWQRRATVDREFDAYPPGTGVRGTGRDRGGNPAYDTLGAGESTGRRVPGAVRLCSRGCSAGRPLPMSWQPSLLPSSKSKPASGGRSELDMSNNTFHVLSGCFFHTIRYFPLSVIVFPDASLKLSSYVPLV